MVEVVNDVSCALPLCSITAMFYYCYVLLLLCSITAMLYYCYVLYMLCSITAMFYICYVLLLLCSIRRTSRIIIRSVVTQR